MPGARVAAYIAAGGAGMSVLRFAGLTAAALALWVAAAAVLGAALFDVAAQAAPAVIATVVGIVIASFAMRWRRSKIFRQRARITFYRWLRWKHHEFWPMWFFYPPVVLYGVYLAIRYRSITALLHVNPSMPLSGIIGESKALILDSMPEHHPSMLRHQTLDPQGARKPFESLKSFMAREGLHFPLILKPDVGQRGSGVQLVRNEDEAQKYLASADFTVVAQEYCAWPEEAGISYVRDPDEARGRITGVTRKRFPVVVGDGTRTVTDLILDDPRARLIAQTYLKRHHERADEVLARGESLRLVEAGNHCQGAIFEDGEALITPALQAAIDDFARAIPEFYAGRFDVRFETEAKLRQGQGFKIIELNGAAGEATHIYDARKSVWQAYSILFQQLDDLYRVGRKNERSGRRASTGLIRALWDFRKMARSHPPTT
ncbi:MAG: carboxylate--amine ligase [Myxococcota bacterium]